jgi:hypothetical protein
VQIHDAPPPRVKPIYAQFRAGPEPIAPHVMRTHTILSALHVSFLFSLGFVKTPSTSFVSYHRKKAVDERPEHPRRRQQNADTAVVNAIPSDIRIFMFRSAKC